jgi:hypothetical protein
MRPWNADRHEIIRIHHEPQHHQSVNCVKGGEMREEKKKETRRQEKTKKKKEKPGAKTQINLGSRAGRGIRAVRVEQGPREAP